MSFVSLTHPDDNRPRHNVAVFVDHDNIAISCKRNLGDSYDYDILLNICQRLGRVVLSRVYLDTTRSNRQEFELFKRRFQPVYAPAFEIDGKRKSLADPLLICDVMETLYEKPAIDTFVIVSGDKDFLPLIRKIAQFPEEKRVVIISIDDSESTALLIKECSKFPCSSFYDYALFHEKEDEKLEMTLVNSCNGSTQTHN